MNNQKYSVVIPAYNAEKFVGEAIESVLKQTYNNWELFVVNDGSIDNTENIVNSYADRDKRVKLIQQNNQGVSVSRNIGAQFAQGEYIAFLDADDRWLPEKLATHLDHLNSNPSIGVSFARVRYVQTNGTPTSLIANCPLTNLKPWNFLYGNPTVTTSNVVVRKQVFQQLGGFDPGMSYSEDMDWFFRILCESQWEIEGIHEILVEYRVHNTGLSSSLYRMEAGWQTLANKASKSAPAIVEQHYNSAYASYLRYLARQSLRLGVPSSTGLDFINRALKEDWNMIFREPKQTCLTAFAIYLKCFYDFFIQPGSRVKC